MIVFIRELFLLANNEFKLMKIYYPYKLKDIKTNFEFRLPWVMFSRPLQPEISKEELEAQNDQIKQLEKLISKKRKNVFISLGLFFVLIGFVIMFGNVLK